MLNRIHLRITVDGRRTEISFKRKIAPDQWCATSNRAKTKGFNRVNKQPRSYTKQFGRLSFKGYGHADKRLSKDI